jgi:hypothetical protein
MLIRYASAFADEKSVWIDVLMKDTTLYDNFIRGIESEIDIEKIKAIEIPN